MRLVLDGNSSRRLSNITPVATESHNRSRKRLSGRESESQARLLTPPDSNRQQRRPGRRDGAGESQRRNEKEAEAMPR